MPSRDPLSPEGPLRFIEKRFASIHGAEQARKRGWSDAKWLGQLKSQGKVRLSLEQALSRLLPLATAAGAAEDVATRAIRDGWKAGEGGAPTVPEQKPSREVPATVAAVARPTGVPELRDVVIAVLADPMVKNKLFALVLDALDVHAVATRETKDEPRGAA
jgi:hypothetical protein